MTRWIWVAAALVGCGFPVGGAVDLAGEACLLGSPAGDAARACVDDVALSFVHLATCADLAGQLDRALDDALVRGAGGQAPDRGPFVADGGQYVSSDGANTVRVTYLLGRTFERAGEAGDPVPADLFALESYLVGAAPRATGEGVAIDYDRPGPLVELLGQGADPPNPIRLSAAELAASPLLAELAATVTIEAHEATGSGVVSHWITTAPAPRAQLRGELPLELEISTDLSCDAGDFAGEAEGVLFRQGARTLTGELSWELLGGEVEAGGTFTWTDQADPVITVSCY